MRKILIWNEDDCCYTIKHLTSEEEKSYEDMLLLIKRAKELYYSVIREAEMEGIPLDRFIDDWAYSAYCQQNKYADEAYKIANRLGVKFNIPRLWF